MANVVKFLLVVMVCRSLHQRISGPCEVSKRGYCCMNRQELPSWMNSSVACGLISNFVLTCSETLAPYVTAT
jgi:hypothetical protein